MSRIRARLLCESRVRAHPKYLVEKPRLILCLTRLAGRHAPIFAPAREGATREYSAPVMGRRWSELVASSFITFFAETLAFPSEAKENLTCCGQSCGCFHRRTLWLSATSFPMFEKALHTVLGTADSCREQLLYTFNNSNHDKFHLPANRDACSRSTE